MRARLREDQDDGGLDSLLDTMTNVVGILVLVLVVTQLGVADVISRITSDRVIGSSDLVEIRNELSGKQNELDELNRILIDPTIIDPERLREELSRKRDLLDRRRSLLSEKKTEKEVAELKISDAKQATQEAETEIRTNDLRRQELANLITEALQKKADIEAKLDETPDLPAPPEFEITIPNPRPAPKGATQVMLVCAENRLYPVNAGKFREAAHEKAVAIITRFNLGQDPAQGIDAESFKKHFERMKDQDDFFNIEYYVQNDRDPRIRFIPRAGRGASIRELVNPRSRIRTRWLVNFDPNRYFARFFVLPDSYEMYVTARRLFSDGGILAGWEPQGEKWQLTSGIPGGIRLGPPPPPKPPDPTRASEKPKPPAKPPNLID